MCVLVHAGTSKARTFLESEDILSGPGFYCLCFVFLILHSVSFSIKIRVLNQNVDCVKYLDHWFTTPQGRNNTSKIKYALIVV